MIYAGVVIVHGTGVAVFAVLFVAGQPPLFAASLALTTFGLNGAIVVAAEVGMI